MPDGPAVLGVMSLVHLMGFPSPPDSVPSLRMQRGKTPELTAGKVSVRCMCSDDTDTGMTENVPEDQFRRKHVVAWCVHGRLLPQS